MKLCKNGLHPKDYKGKCRACRAERDRAYKLTERGAEANRRASRNYYYRQPGIVYQRFLLGKRRREALKRRGKSGEVSDEG